MSRIEIDWDLIRLFLQVAHSGSLSKAAQLLSQSQPTLSRQIQQLEQQTGVQLFKRTPRGLVLSEAAARLLESAEAMQDAADRFARLVMGMEERIRGDLRISVSEIVGIYYLPPALAQFQLRYPEVNVEIVISNETISLSKREADIALRMFSPQQGDLLCRRLPDVELGFFAHKDYVNDDPDIIGTEKIQNYRFIGYDNETSMIEGARALGFDLTRDSFSLRSDSLTMQLALIQAGAGMGITHVAVARTLPGLVQLFKQIPVPALEFWCVCHRDVQYNLRIITAMRFFSDWFSRSLLPFSTQHQNHK